MIVMRVDSTDINVWSKNKVNCDPNHNYYEMLRAGNSAYGESASDPFPGTSANVMITNETAPDLMTWAGLENDFNIMNIQEKNGIISFTVLENGSLLIGDVNDDGLIDIDDVTALIDMLLNGEASQSEVADVDGNGQINIHDVTALIDYILTGDMPQD